MATQIDSSAAADANGAGASPARPPMRQTTTSSSASVPRSPASTTPSSSFSQRMRSASLRLLDSNPPSGMWSATGQLASRAPSFSELRRTGSNSSYQYRQSQTIQSPTIPETTDTHSRSSISGTPFMTPLQTPLAMENSDYMAEPESIDLEGGMDGGDEVNRRPSSQKTKGSDNTLHAAEMRQDADLYPALAIISNGEMAEETPEDNIQARTPTKRRSVLRKKSLKNKENEPPSTGVEEEMDTPPRRWSKNLDKFFGEKPRNVGTSMPALSGDDQPKRRSKNLDKFFGEDASKAGAAATTAAKPERDFADRMEGDEDDFPDILFGRDSMPTQSYDPNQKRTRSAQPSAPARDSAPRVAPKPSVRGVESLTQNTENAEPAVLIPKETAPAPAEKNLAAGASASAAPHGEEEEEEEEEEIDWDEFMREFDERPPRQSKRISKDISKFFGEDPKPAAGAASRKAQAETSTRTTQSPPAQPHTAVADRGVSSRQTPSPMMNGHAAPLAAAHATEKPGATLAAAELQAEKAAKTAPSPAPSDGIYPTGYRFPPKKTAWQGFLAAMKAFGRFAITPLGFFVTLYGLLVVAWGGMLFLLLCNASPAMCTLGNGEYSCNDINSPRRVWIEYDSQILNALFCVTGFGLIPWRFRDFYYLMKFRLGGHAAAADGIAGHDAKSSTALRRLASYHTGWFRLPASASLPVPSSYPADRVDLAAESANLAYPLPARRAPLLPLTGRRAPATPLWKMDFVVWAFVANTALQGCLSGFMWGLNRYTRPSWSTGLFVALACIVAAAGGIVQFVEGRKIKDVEGVPWGEDGTGLGATDVEEGRGSGPASSGEDGGKKDAAGEGIALKEVRPGRET